MWSFMWRYSCLQGKGSTFTFQSFLKRKVVGFESWLDRYSGTFESTTSHSTVKHSTEWANPAAVKTIIIIIITILFTQVFPWKAEWSLGKHISEENKNSLKYILELLATKQKYVLKRSHNHFGNRTQSLFWPYDKCFIDQVYLVNMVHWFCTSVCLLHPRCIKIPNEAKK